MMASDTSTFTKLKESTCFAIFYEYPLRSCLSSIDTVHRDSKACFQTT